VAILGTTDANSPPIHVDFLPGGRDRALAARRSRLSRNEPRRWRRIRQCVADPPPGRYFPGNVAFDHYFATYPIALNPNGQPAFHAADDTPSVNGLGSLINGNPDGVLLTNYPDASNPANGSSALVRPSD
jgi:hypothetical protein